ncbi:MAG: SEC-C metal-binding domain-containing protein [Defluviitaleaceae bacterium]|nr:SEC-C metal-binding domain-containing protein [Defluviitaleaceae bacterium]
MSIYERWITQAYDRLGQTVPAHWNTYLPQEQKIYEELLENKGTAISGTLAELAQKYNMPVENFLGFVDGINEALDKPFSAEEVQAFEESTNIDVSFQFENLYKKMVEYKADHLYELPQWDNVFTPERQEELYVEQKRSTTVRKEAVPGRNEPCPCGSGKKYKKCCGA